MSVIFFQAVGLIVWNSLAVFGLACIIAHVAADISSGSKS